MGFFKRIGNLISGDDQNSNKSNGVREDSGKIRQRIKDSLLKELDALYLTNVDATKNKELLIWMAADSLTFNSFDGFENELLEYFLVERDYSFSKIGLKLGEPENYNECRKVVCYTESNEIVLYLQEPPKKANASIVKKATITIVKGKGDLIKDKYELSSDALLKGNKKFYNIGRGENPTMDNNEYRHNDIAIDSINNQKVNGYVSRAHARIGYSETIGFYIQVERGGSRLYDSRTRIIRDEEKIEVENINVKVPLVDGDLIELGKAVVLRYNVEQ